MPPGHLLTEKYTAFLFFLPSVESTSNSGGGTTKVMSPSCLKIAAATNSKESRTEAS